LFYFFKDDSLGWVSDFCTTDLPDILGQKLSKRRQKWKKSGEIFLFGEKINPKCLLDCYFIGWEWVLLSAGHRLKPASETRNLLKQVDISRGVDCRFIFWPFVRGAARNGWGINYGVVSWANGRKDYLLS